MTNIFILIYFENKAIHETKAMLRDKFSSANVIKVVISGIVFVLLSSVFNWLCSNFSIEQLWRWSEGRM